MPGRRFFLLFACFALLFAYGPLEAKKEEATAASEQFEYGEFNAASGIATFAVASIWIGRLG